MEYQFLHNEAETFAQLVKIDHIKYQEAIRIRVNRIVSDNIESSDYPRRLCTTAALCK